MEEAGEGALRRAFEELQGEARRRRPVRRRRASAPCRVHPRRLGVITSPSGAAVRDVLSVLARRFPLLEVEILPVPVQGASAAAQIDGDAARASRQRPLRRAAADPRRRLAGGPVGVQRRSSWRARSPRRAVPVVSAVGHETDFSLADFAADLRAPTPSAAAELLVPERGGPAAAPAARCDARAAQPAATAPARGDATRRPRRAAPARRCVRRRACSCCAAPGARACAASAPPGRRSSNAIARDCAMPTPCCAPRIRARRLAAPARAARPRSRPRSAGARIGAPPRTRCTAPALAWRARCIRSARWRRWRAVTRSCSTTTAASCAACCDAAPGDRAGRAIGRWSLRVRVEARPIGRLRAT